MAPYANTTWGQLKDSLSQRLGDTSVFWTDAELAVYLTEALRAFGAAAFYWRERVVFNTVAGQAFYVLPTVAAATLAMTATDRETFKAIQYSLIEPTNAQTAAWTPTEMFTLAQVVGAMNDMRNRYLTETGCVLTRDSALAMPGPPDGRVNLDDLTIDVRRVAWVRTADSTHHVLWREDEWSEAAYNATYEGDSTTSPYAYTVTATAPVQLLVAPPPGVPGTLDIITVANGATLDPASADTPLGLPNNVSPAVKWGALHDLLLGDGVQTDPVRALAADRRWAEFVELGKMASSVANVMIAGSSLMPVSLFDMDAALGGTWQDTTGQPTVFAVAGWNIVAVYPVPDGVYGITADVIRNAPIPTNDADYVQVGLEDIETLINYAEYCALFKVGGDDLQRSEERIREFYKAAGEYNAKLKANALFAKAIFGNTQPELAERPRRLEEHANAEG